MELAGSGGTRSTLTHNDLIASHFTLAGAPFGRPASSGFEDRLQAAATAGFQAVGLHADSYAALSASGLSPVEMRAMAGHYGIAVAELEFLFGWARPDRSPRSQETEQRLYEMADLFGSRSMNVGVESTGGQSGSRDEVAERFAALCDRAAAHDLIVALEFMPWSDVPNVHAAVEIVRTAGRRNGGVLVDAWHHFRSGADAETLASVPMETIVAVQLADGDEQPIGTLIEDTLTRRRLPGEGSFDLLGLVRTLSRLGARIPISVEILSDEHFSLPVGTAACVAFEATQRLLARARS